MATGANRSGRRLEDFVADVLNEREYLLVPPVRFFPARELEQPIYTRQCEIGQDLYGKKRRVDAILYHPRLYSKCLVIQCKWQASGGSVEEKYPFEVLSISQNQFDTIIILDGDGYSAGAKQWLTTQAGQEPTPPRVHARGVRSVRKSRSVVNSEQRTVRSVISI